VSDIDFEHIKVIIGIQVEAEVEHPLVNPAELVVNGVDGRVDDFLDDPVDEPWAQEPVRTVTPCPARIQVPAEVLNRCKVLRVKSRLVVLREHPEGQDMAAIEVGKK